MASTLALGPVTTAVLAALRATIALTTYVGARVYPDSNGDAPQKPTYPYVAVESHGETPFNTMGSGVSALKWGSVAQIGIRIASQSRSDAQVTSIASIVKGALDGQVLVVSGYASVDVSYASIVPIEDLTAGVPTREWLVLVDVTVHQ